MEKQKQQEILDQYVKGTLSEAERKAIDGRIRQDAPFARETESHKDAFRLLLRYGDLDLKRRLQRYERSRGRRISIIRRSAAVLALLIAVGLGWYLLDPHSPQSTPQHLFAQYFEPYRAPIMERSAGEEAGTWQRAATAYGKGDFKTAAGLFDEAGRSDQMPAYINQFYLAMSLLALDNAGHDRAIELLQPLSTDSHDYAQPARWYLAMAYLQAGQADMARSVLQEIRGEGGYKSEEASELLRSMDVSR